MPFPRRMRLFIKRIEMAPIPEPALDFKGGMLGGERERISAIRLKFYGVRPGLFRRLKRLHRALKAAAMISRELGDDQAALRRPFDGAYSFHLILQPTLGR